MMFRFFYFFFSPKTSGGAMPFLRTLVLAFLIHAASAHAAMQNQYALVFFFESTCPYCHKTAPKITRLGERFQ
ncbi:MULTISPECIES: conjugal transfer protein TraF, partial [Vibrio]|uniref:conjugal transfer protein TraF n=1 Tax=Vibrio TaxID=662 RepID=UPI003211EDDF